MKLLLDALKIKKADILGWSDGGNTGLIMAMKYPDRINKLAVTGAVLNSSKEALDGKVFDEINQRLQELKDKTDGYSIEQKRLAQLILDEPNILPESLENIKAPTLVMAGDRDLVKDQHTRTIASNIPKSKLVIFKDATHYVPREKSEEFNKTVIDFLK
jgi:pimeloyl-ACP methyl ester carboxylesterase